MAAKYIIRIASGNNGVKADPEPCNANPAAFHGIQG
jgi:hypothetical protein